MITEKKDKGILGFQTAVSALLAAAAVVTALVFPSVMDKGAQGYRDMVKKIPEFNLEEVKEIVFDKYDYLSDFWG